MNVEPIQPYLEPLRKTAMVQCTAARAFEIFTDRIGAWWPTAKYSISQERVADVILEPRLGGEVYEIRDDGMRCPWGRILAWEPPHRLAFSWHPGRDPETAQEVEIHFVALGEETRVDLEHRGWAKLGEQAEMSRQSYDGGWQEVLGARFVEACSALETGGTR